MKHLIVGTAGHIDHGKSALVKALTGIDPDRLKEEKERGLTIDLGFAYLELPDGTRVGFVDVPGHERFVKNMLAGAAGMDIVILVVDATESVMPQTREHLDIMRLLGISRGIVAVTKIDIADAEMVEIVEAELKELVEGTFLETAPIVKVSAKTSEGLDEIKRLIAEAVKEQQQKNESGLFRFPIDRVFTMKGFGTVVTGTVFSGSLEEDEPVLVLPAGLNTRARQLQSHNVKVERISAGMRAAMNLTNVSVEQLQRGDALVRPGTAEATSVFDARIRLLSSAPRKLPKSSTAKLYIATSQQVVRMSLIDKPVLAPGGEGYAQLRSEKLLCAFRGDRFVFRGESPEITLGGGIILDVAPAKFKRKSPERIAWLEKLEKATPAETALAFLSQKEIGASLREIAIRMGEPIEQVHAMIEESIRNRSVIAFGAGAEMLLISSDRFEQLKNRVIDEMSEFFKCQSHRLFMPREELRSRLGAELDSQIFEKVLAELIGAGKVEAPREGVTLKGRQAGLSEDQKSIKKEIEKIYIDAGFSPPTFSQVEEQLNDAARVRQMQSLLVEEGTLIKISPTMAYHKDFLNEASDKIKVHFQNADKLAVGDLKTILGVSRKHAVPLLEYFDKIGFTLRVGDYRVLKQKSQK